MIKYKKRLVLSFILLTLFIALAIGINIKEELVIDTRIYGMISKLQCDTMTNFFKIITNIGNPKFVACVCIIALLFDKTKVKVGLPICFSVIIEGIFNIIFKNIFARQRPELEHLIYEDSFSFPSGHAMVTAALFTMIIYLSCEYVENKKVRNVINIVCLLLILLIGISRIYLRVHYFSDILAGWSLGTIVTIIVATFFNRIKNKDMYKI